MSTEKEQLAKWLTENNIEFEPNLSAVQLKRLRLSEIERLMTGEMSTPTTTTSSATRSTTAHTSSGSSRPATTTTTHPIGDSINSPTNTTASTVTAISTSVQSSVPKTPITTTAASTTPATASTPIISVELQRAEAEADAELRILAKRAQIAQLQAELATLGHNTTTTTNFTVREPLFDDIKHCVVPFSGPNEYDAYKWLDDFERACAPLNCDDVFRLKCMQRLMKPDTEAEWFIRVDKSTTYSEFRANFLVNFGHRFTSTEITDRMKKTFYVPSKMSFMGYILQMQELGSRVNLEESQVLRFIIDGLRDTSSCVSILYSATTIDQLKALAPRYLQIRESHLAQVRSNAARVNTNNLSATNNAATNPRAIPKITPSATNNAATIPKATTSTPASQNVVRCFNCSGLGHISANCTERRRTHGSCFRCGSEQHVQRDCPHPSPRNTNQVALVDSFRQVDIDNENNDDINSVNEENIVSVAFPSGDSSRLICDTFVSLFDTGSPVSLLRRSAIPNQCIRAPIDQNTKYSGYSGLGNFRLCTYGIIPIQIGFRKIIKTIDVYVVSDHLIPYPLLLGRNFLSAFRIKLFMHCRNKTVTPKIECDKNLNKLKVSNKVLHCVYDSPNKPFRTGTPCDLCHSVVNKRPIQPNYVSIASVNGPIHSVPDIFAINLDNTTCGYDINPNLNEFHKESIIRLIKENYVDTHKIEEFPHDYEMKLRLTSDMPISFPPRRLSYSDKLEVDKMVAELLDQGFIRPSNSPYAFPMIVVPKKTGERRMCVDYRPLNKVTLRDNYPLPLIDDCLERMENKNYFSLLDLKSGFHQIRMSVDSIPLTSFVTPSGQYEYLRMPFGLRNAPAVFQRFINWVLRPFINEGSVIVYIDDIAIASKTIPEHFDLLGKVLRRLAEFRLEIKLSKCLFCYSEIDLLGFTISSNGIRPNNRQIESISKTIRSG